ncbi:unnamed protein product, partial [Discosporangium mesarthrocarpum]
TYLVDGSGSCCAMFDPGPFLEHPITAFAAGEFTTLDGVHEGALAYVTGEGGVMVFHGLHRQMGALALRPFLQGIHEEGVIETLRGLLTNFHTRLGARKASLANSGDDDMPSSPGPGPGPSPRPAPEQAQGRCGFPPTGPQHSQCSPLP